MAVLLDPESASPEILGARHLVGRSVVAHTLIRDRAVSGDQAVFQWTGSHWELRDLGSRNGTWVGGQQLRPGERRTLSKGDEIAFGDPSRVWVLESAAAPTVAAWTDGIIVEGEGRLLALPTPDDPLVVIELDPVHGWQLHRHGEASPVTDAEVVDVGGVDYTVRIPSSFTPIPVTAELGTIYSPQKTVGNMVLHFGVSADEEYIELTAKVGSARRQMPPRVHHYLLLILARQRLMDESEGVADAEQGWMYTSDLRQGLRISPNQYYVMVHRLRREAEDLGVMDASQLIEKRTTSRQVRIGTANLTIRNL